MTKAKELILLGPQVPHQDIILLGLLAVLGAIVLDFISILGSFNESNEFVVLLNNNMWVLGVSHSLGNDRVHNNECFPPMRGEHILNYTDLKGAEG